MFLLVVSLFVGLIPTGHFNFVMSRFSVANNVNLGSFLYPTDCDGFDASRGLHFDCWLRGSEDGEGGFNSKGYENGTCGLALCKVAGEPLMKSTPADDAVFRKVSLATVLWSTTTWQAVLPESPAACFFSSGMISESQAYVSLVTSLLLLTYGFTVRVAKVFGQPAKMFTILSQERLDRSYQAILGLWARQLGKIGPKAALFASSMCIPLQNSLYCTFCVFLHLYTSMMAEASGFFLGISELVMLTYETT